MSTANHPIRTQLYSITKNNISPCLPVQREIILGPRITKSVAAQLANTLGLEFLPQPHYNISFDASAKHLCPKSDPKDQTRGGTLSQASYSNSSPSEDTW